MVQFSEIKQSLQSATLKNRREAVKQLELQLASPRFLRQLDVNTVKLWPHEKLQLLSWPGLVDTYLNYMHKEVTQHKKQLDAAAIKVFRTIFTAADNAERCGPGRNNLLRRAGAAFDKFGKMLEAAPEGEGLGTALGKEIASVLLKVLLPNPLYCQRGTVTAFQSLMEEAMLRSETLRQLLEEHAAKTAQQAAAATATGRLAPAARGAGAPSAAAMQQELFIMANVLTGLLAGVPGQLAGPFVLDLVAFLAQSLAWLDEQGEYGRTSRQLMACLNGLLLSYGADLRPHLPSTFKVIGSYIKHAWTAHTSVPVKDGVLCFCRLSLALGSIPAAGGGVLLNDLLSSVTKEINSQGFSWDLQHNKQHQQLAPLAASLYYHAAFAPAAGATASSTPSASGGTGTAEVGSCGSNGEGACRHTQVPAKRRASNADAGRTAAAGGGVSGDEGSSDDEVLQLPRKRSRVLGAAGQLLLHLQADPERWCPVVALLLHQHGPLVPPAFRSALQQQLTASAARCISALGHQVSQAAAESNGAPGVTAALSSVRDRRSASPAAAGAPAVGTAAGARAVQLQQQQLLWLVRCLCELALCWPAALHPLAAPASGGVGVGDRKPAASPGGVLWDDVGICYNALDGSCTQQAWPHDEVAAAQASCSSRWQQLWESCVSILAATGQQQVLTVAALQDSMAWLLHVLAAHKLAQLPASKAAVLMALQRFWLPAQEDRPAGQQEEHAQLQHQVVLSDAQLALLLSLCLGQQVSSHKEVQLRQLLLQACLSTAEAWSSRGRRASRFSSGVRAGSMEPPAPVAVPPSAASTPGKTLPDLLLPAMLALLGAPGLPTPSLNGASAAATMGSAAAAKLVAMQSSWLFPAGPNGNPATAAAAAAAARSAGTWADGALGRVGCSGAASTVWYAAAEVWWAGDQQLEAQLVGLETGLETLQRQLADQQLQQVLRAAAAASAAGASTAASSAASIADDVLPPVVAAAILVGWESDGTVKQDAVPAGLAEEGADTGWWKCWCRLADEAAEHLCNALLPCTPAGQDVDAAHPWDASQETLAADGIAASDPVQHLSYLLLLLNLSVSLPSVAALQLRLHEQQQHQLAIEKQNRKNPLCVQPDDQQPKEQAQKQQQGRLREDVFCGFGFSRHPEQHLQLQQLVMEAGIKAGQLLADNLQHLPCQPGSTWLQQLMHLGASLARIQALMTALPPAQGHDNSQAKYQMLVAASFLAEVVKVLERLTTHAAAAASAEPDEDMDGGGAGGDPDFDDDFMDAAPAPSSRHGAFGSTQQPAASMMGTPAASFRPTQSAAAFTAFTRPAAGTAAAGGSTAGGGASGPAVLVGGGLAGFCGRAEAGLGNPSAIWSPVLLLAPHNSSSSSGPSQPGFAVGGLGEGLSGLAGVEGAGLRVFAALSPAYGDTAQALLRLWRHMAGLAGWAPPDALLQAVVETATTAVCAGGWSHLQQLFGLLTGSHALLSAQKVPTSTCHLILRLLQQVAAAAAAGGVPLDEPCQMSASQASQDVAELSSQQEPGSHHTYLSVMFDIFEDVQRRLGIRHDQPAAMGHLPQSTQLQLGLTTLAFLQLQPQAGLDSSTTAAGSTSGSLSEWRRNCLLPLLQSRSSLCRMRAGPLVAAMLTALAASVAPAAPSTNGASSSGPSVSHLVQCAVAEAAEFLSLQGSATLTQEQADRVSMRQAAQHPAGAAAGSARQDWEDTTLTPGSAVNRAAQQDALLWEIAVVQLVNLAQAAPASSSVALQRQEPPNVLDAHLLRFLLRHTACVQLLPADALPLQAPDSAAAGSSQAGSSGDASSARVRAMHNAAVALDVMAWQQQYSSRFAYLQYHAGAWLRELVATGGQSVQQLLAIQAILCPAPGADASSNTVTGGSAAALEAVVAAAAAASGVSQGADSACLQLLQAYGCSLVFWLIYCGSNKELAALAAASGLGDAALLQVYTHELCSHVYPLLKVPELKAAIDMFRAKLPASADNLTNQDSYALVFSLFEMSLPVLQQPPGEWHPQQQTPGLRLDVTLPFITQAAADKGLTTIAKLWSNTHWLVALPFSPADVQVLLLMVHRSLVAAAHPLHKLQRLGQLQCLLRQLPDTQLVEPSVARSLIGMLLQNLQVPELQGFCCSCLQQLLVVYSNALPTLYDEQGRSFRAGQSADKAALSAKEKQAQARSKAREQLVQLLLKELLPPVVAALVQCVETAADGLQLQQQRQLWALQVNGAAAAPGAAGGSAPLDLPSSLAPVSTLLSTCSFLQTKGMGQLMLDLLPPLPVLAAVAKQQGWQSHTVSFLLPWFVERAANMTASSRQRAAQELLSKLRQDPDELFWTKHDLWRLSGQAPDVMLQPGNRELKYIATDRHFFDEQVPDPHLVTASFELARLGAQLGDSHVMRLAAELLAVIGPMDPDVITLDHAAAAAAPSSSSGGVHHVYTHSTSSSSGSAAASHTDRTAFPLKAVLELLVDSLFDEQPHVVSTAQDSMAALVSAVGDDIMQSALQPPARKPDQEAQGPDRRLLQSYVNTYIGSRGSTSSKQVPGPGAVVAALQAAASVELWSPVGKPYSQWLCGLSSTLLRACGGVQDTTAPAVTRRTGRSAAAAAASIPATASVLALLADAAAINPQLAELLLPHAVLKLCESDHSGADVPGAGSQGWAARLGAAASAGLQLDSLTGSPAATWQADGAVAGAWGSGGGVGTAAACRTAGVDAACYSVLLACLEHNRSVQQAAWSPMPCDPAPAPVAWQRCFCLHLDYLAVAAAAMAVEAYFTALLYVEHCCSELLREGRNPFQGTVADSGIMQLQQLAGVGTANGVDSGQQPVEKQQQQLLESLLLQLYSNINEPDGVYAVVAAFGSPASQLQLLQHEQRWAAVLGRQDALLQAAVLQPLGQQQQGGSLHVTGALTALQRFGCPATAQKCIAGVLQDHQQQQAHVQHAAPLVPLPRSLAESGRQQQYLQQQQQAQQLLDAQSELAWRLSDWGLADTLNPAAEQQQGWSTGFEPSSSASAGLQAAQAAAGGHQGSSFHAAVLGALTALQHRDHDGFNAQVSGAQQDCVLRLARSSTQSAAAVNPLLVQLQMLKMLSQGALITKSSQAAAPPPGTAVDWPTKAASAFLSVLAEGFSSEQGGTRAAVALSGVNFELSDQLLSLQAALSKVLRRPDALLATLQGTMRVARRAGQVNFAAAALQQLQETLHQAVLGAKLSAHGPLGLGLHTAALAAPGVDGSGSAGAQLPGWIQRAVAADSGWPLEAVKIRWLQGQHQAALKELQGLEQQLAALLSPVLATQTFSSPRARFDASKLACALMRARMQLGKWLAAGEGSTSNVQGAMQQLQAAAAVAQAVHQHRDLGGDAELQALHCAVCYQLAICADQQYQVLDAQMASPEFQKQQQVLKTKQQLFEQLKSAVAATQNWARQPPDKQASAKQAYQQVVRRYAETQRQVELDRLAVSQLQDGRMQYLNAALGAYRNCIAAGDEHDLQAVYRMCGLWFRHSEDATVNKVMQQTFQQVPTAKFVPLVYQIASRMDNTQSPFQVVLTDALFLMAKDHPYHTLYPLIALSNGDTEGGDPAAKNAHIRHETNTARVAAASALLQRVRAVEPLQPIVDDMTAQVTDLIGMTLQVHKALPRHPNNQVAVDQFTMPTNFRRRLKSLPHAPPICYTLPLDTARRYTHVPAVVEIDTVVKIAGGINTPLIIRTTDDSGRTQRQLCKCNDDLRQDAVMQQFFGLVDTLLKGSSDSKQRRLGYRTYRVVPCSPLVGVLEWVEGTTPMTEYLLGSREANPPYSGGASARYHHPGDLGWMECYVKMDKSKPENLAETYLNCCKHFPPVFRHFFLEAFPDPSEWFEARTRYTRSTAVASMAGAVIGLGDRHLGNILLDMHSAEAVHIDLGIAFEQGLFLQTAEQVPFRLTPNIVDGMGAAGVEGTFRRCCETTMQVLRQHQDALLTVVQVVLHDPLYRWQMTPVKAGRKQQDPMAQQQGESAAAADADGGDGSAAAAAAAGGTAAAAAAGVSSGALGNADAERAVLRVKQKLQGQDVEGGAALSVEAQVAAMLQAARDPERLCRMFKGWAAWV